MVRRQHTHPQSRLWKFAGRASAGRAPEDKDRASLAQKGFEHREPACSVAELGTSAYILTSASLIIRKTHDNKLDNARHINGPWSKLELELDEARVDGRSALNAYAPRGTRRKSRTRSVHSEEMRW